MRTIKAIGGAAVILGALWVLAAVPARLPTPPAGQSGPESVGGIPSPVADYILTLRPGRPVAARGGSEPKSVRTRYADAGQPIRAGVDPVEWEARFTPDREAGE